MNMTMSRNDGKYMKLLDRISINKLDFALFV